MGIPVRVRFRAPVTVIIYDFRCDLEHRFEGWFGSQDDCERQLHAGQVRCPVCDGSTVTRVPSALHVKRTESEPVRRAPAEPRASMAVQGGEGASPQAAGGDDPVALREAMDRLRRWVASTEDVGPAFAEEARRIHNQEAPERAIRGVTTPAEARALSEEGIPVLPLPAHLVDKQH
jgi:hypothetical protein